MSKTHGHLKDEISVSIKYKLVSIVSILIIVTVLIIIIISTFLFRTDNETRIKENNHMLSKTIALKTRSDLESILSKLKTIDLIELNSLSANYQNKRIKNLYFTESSDLVFIGIAKKIANNFVFKDLYYNNEYIKNSSLSQKLLIATSQKYKDKYESVFKGATLVFNASVDLSEPIICMINPYKTLNHKITMIQVTYLRTSIFKKSFESSDEITEIFMVSSNGDIIGHSNTDLVRIGANLINSPIIEMMKRSPLSNGHLRYQNEDGKYYLGSFHRTGFAGIGILAISDEEKIFNTVYKMQRLTIYVTIIVLAMAIMIVFIIGNGITAPIQKVVEAVKKIQNGIFHVDIQAETRDEIGLLTRSVVQMGIGLEEREKIKNEFEQLRELDKLKTNFFTNISHEIRTPLTLILSPVESVLQGDYKKDVDKEFVKNIQKNAIRLLRLVNNILDFSKIEEGRMTLSIQEVDIITLLKNYVDNIKLSAKSKKIDIKFTSPINSLTLFLDISKFDKISMNLLSNALKFIEKGGHLEIKVGEDDKKCYIEFEDTGIGIPPDKLETVFERFRQADGSSTRKHEGTGIGLSLTKELVEMHGGSITLQSRHVDEHPEDHGSVFTITIPKGREHLEGRPQVEFIIGSELEESVSDNKRFIGMREMIDFKEPDVAVIDNKSEFTIETDGEVNPNILVVEDNVEMRDFLKNLLEDIYTVNFAVDGLDGIEKAKEFKPDLIITDVMMPNMDGYQMTQAIKKDEQLQRIPVLMLTAQVEIEHKIEGLEYGADDYLTKPFNSRELLVRLKNLLEKRDYEKAISERNRVIEEELETARLLQQKLLPENILQVSGYKFHAIYIPMDKVGGDFYDYKEIDNCIQLFIADVSGHGLPGAFLSMITKMALDGITSITSTSNALYILNDVLCKSTVKNNYVTAVCCLLDRETNILRYSNAGHFPPIVYRKNSDVFFELQTKGTSLGWTKELDLDENELQLKSDDRLILYTDGIIECKNNKDEQFSDEGFKVFIKNNIMLPPDIFTAELIKHLKGFSGRDTFMDDICLVVVDIL